MSSHCLDTMVGVCFLLSRRFAIVIIFSLGTCRNLPFGGRATQGSRVRLPREEGARSRHQRLFEENVRKMEKCDLQTLIVKGSGVVFTHGESVSTPCVRHKGHKPLTKCAISCLRFILFSLFDVFMSFYVFCIFYLFVVDKGVSLAPMYPQFQ